jgi:hypothetical protein
MNSLAELKDHFVRNDIAIKEFMGWYLKVGKDTWTMSNGVFYCNNVPRSMKEKTLLDNYERKIVDSIETKVEAEEEQIVSRKWKAMSSRKVTE